MRIGEFGTAPDERAEPVELDTFGYFGKEIRVHPDLAEIPELVMADVAELVISAETADGTRTMAFSKQLLRLVTHPEDFDAVWALARKNRQDIEQIAEITNGIIAALTERPTEQQPASSGGLLRTAPSSEDESLSVQREFEARGRTDLALIVSDVRQAREAASV